MLNDLQALEELVYKLNLNNSNSYKKEILKEYPQCKELLRLVYSPFIQFNIRSDVIKKNLTKSLSFNIENKTLVDWEKIPSISIYDFLSALYERKVTGNAAIAFCSLYLLHAQPQHKDIIYKIIDKNLDIRIGTKTINKIFPGLIKEFNVALAAKYEDQKDKIDFENDAWFVSRKLDGVRCIAIKRGDDITFYSRNGKPFETLDELKQPLLELSNNISNSENIVFDGEICLMDENGNEDFQNIMKEIRRKDHTIRNPKYIMFDCLRLEEFENAKSKIPFRDRYYLRLWKASKLYKHQNIECLEQRLIDSHEEIGKWLETAIKNNWEGVMLRKDVPYKGKRTNDLLKVKKFHDKEYKVIRAENNYMRIINEHTKLEQPEEMLARVIILHKGNEVGVGSGFSLDERRHFYKHPEDIVNKIITVKYFDETIDQNGKHSLRFPIMKCVHGEKRQT